MDSPWKDEALEALLDYSKLRDMPYKHAYRSGERILVTDGCLILRLAVERPETLEALKPFPMQEQIEAWKYPVALFRVDVGTLADWAKNDEPLITDCLECEGIGSVAISPEDYDPEAEDKHGPCEECDGVGSVAGHASYGWLTSKRVVDRRYVEMIVATAAETDTIDVRAMSHQPDAGIRFRAKHWDAFLMPFREKSLPAKAAISAPLWSPEPVLEGEHA